MLLQITSGQTLIAKVSDFGTVRVNIEQDRDVIRTSERTHASTQQVCGTGPYISPEYEKRGHVSPRTDSFALGECGVGFSKRIALHAYCLSHACTPTQGIVIIELITGLHPVVVRELVDESFFEELPDVIKQHYDGNAAMPALSAAQVESPQFFQKCVWPDSALQQLSVIAAKCCRLQTKVRSTIAEVLPALEELGNAGAAVQ